MKATNKIPLFCLLIAFICLTLTTILRRGESGSEGKYERPDTIVLSRVDTVYDTISITKYYPKPVKEEVLRIDTLYNDTILERERRIYCDTITFPVDTVCVMTEIEGIDARMNYLKAYLKKGTITEHTTQTVTITKRKKGLMFAPNVSVGYGLINRKPDIYLGCGITYVF